MWNKIKLSIINRIIDLIIKIKKLSNKLLDKLALLGIEYSKTIEYTLTNLNIKLLDFKVAFWLFTIGIITIKNQKT